ncbi:MAG: efflux RND transporter periplasmic adaptor subunit, partial [Methyloprofundus sp.]|nr:efflux RND transporter periplasmic adaptor subunit [Methyloprofundus sp.]
FLNTDISVADGGQLVTVQKAFQTTTLTGFTRARHSIPIASEISGKVTHIYADIGQAIPEDGIFACLDKTFIELDIATTENSIAQLYTDLKYLRKQANRHKKLVKTNSAAVSVFDDLKRQKENASFARQREKINKQKQQETEKRHCIKAPKNWKITQRNIEVGQWITAESPIAQAGDYSQLLIPLALTPEELSSLEQKQNKFTIYLPEYQQEIPASIERISPAFDEQSHKIRVDLLIDDTSKFNRGGIRAELTLDVSDRLNTYLISKNALDERFEEVWLTRKNGERIRVMLLGYLNNNTAKISSSSIKIGDQFKLQQP